MKRGTRKREREEKERERKGRERIGIVRTWVFLLSKEEKLLAIGPRGLLHISTQTLDKHTFRGSLPDKDVKNLPKQFNTISKTLSFELCHWLTNS